MAAAMSDFNENRMETDNSAQSGQTENSRSEAETKCEKSKVDFSNGFENSHRPYVADERLLAGLQATAPPQQHSQNKDHIGGSFAGPGGYLTSTLRQSLIGDERHSLSTQHHQQQPDGNDSVSYVLQTSSQTPLGQPQGQMIQDYPDHSHHSQMRQFEASQVSQQVHSYGDQARYVSRDPSCRDSALYAHIQSPRNPVFSTSTGGYVTVQHPQLPPQSVSPQPPFYSSIIIPTQTLPVTQDYTQFSALPQYSYGQIPKNLINPIPYNPHMGIYPGQQFRPSLLPNQQRFPVDMTQYQGQPIIQPISQNIIGGSERAASARGPKPMVPPRGNSKITHDAGHRKSASTDITGGKLENLMIKCEITNQKGNESKDETPVASSSITNPTSGTERAFATPLNQTPRTRQDGLYVDTSTNQITKNKPIDSSMPECDLYVTCSEHRKSMSVDVSTSFQKRNDTITFTFPGEIKHSQEMKKSITSGDKAWADNQLCADHQRRTEPIIRVSPIGADLQQDTSYVQTATEQKPDWAGISPNTRSIISHDNRRSEHFDDRRSSPMITDTKHSDDIRSSPMSFMAIRDSLNDRINQKTPLISAQNFEKTKQELANWAEQRQRQDIEKQMYQGQMFSTSPKPKNKPEYQRDLRASYVGEEHRLRDHRALQTAFQPIPNISPNTIMEQRRHLRHVSADLTKQMELTRKEFDDQSTTGSVTNLIPVVNTASSQRNSPNICHQFPALSDATFDAKMGLTIVTDFDNSGKTFKQTDHIIHGHKKAHNVSTNLLTHSKSHIENLQMVSMECQSEDKSANQHQQHQQHQHKFQQNQQSLDIISEKLSQFERQQNDLQQRLQCLQNQNKILDQVAQFQHMQSDLHTRLQCLQERQATEKTLRHATDFQQKKVLTTLPEHLFSSLPENETKHQQLPSSPYLPSINFQTYTSHSTSSNKLSPRISDNAESERNPQIALSDVLKYEKTEGPRISLSYPATYQTPPVVTAPTMLSDNMVISSAGSQTLPSSIISSKMLSESVSPGTFKKIPPEKPPRTSRIAQSPEVEKKSQVLWWEFLNDTSENSTSNSHVFKRAPVRLETSLSTKSSIVTKEEVTVSRNNKVIDERSRETHESNYYVSSTSEIWEPVGMIKKPRNPCYNSDQSRSESSASSDQGYTTNNSTNNVLRGEEEEQKLYSKYGESVPDCMQQCLNQLSNLGLSVPEVNPTLGNLSQTSGGNARGPGFSSSANICGSTTSMVNGANLESQDIRDNVGDRDHALVYRDGNLVSGSLEALVQHMVPTEEYYPDRAYLFAFLLSSRLFIKPHELLSEVCALCEHQQKLGGEGGKERFQRFVPRLVQLLAEWTETFPYDFRDERVMAHVKSITQKVASVDATARQEVSALLQNLLLRLTALERYEEGLARLTTESGAQQLSQVDVTELCPSAMILAQQLTHVELERLSYIGPEEFVQAFAKESPHLETSFKEMKKTRNLESYVSWFNRLSYFVATEICKHAKKKQRVRVVEYWIETARECFNIGNFNSLMAIIAGLNMSPISRLKKTWSKVQSAKFAILEHQMDPSSNFSSYRSTLKAAMWRSVGATDERQRIVVPFFSLLVKDLYFLNEGCSNKLPNGHINFEKFWQLAKQVTEFIAWKQVTCPFEKNSRVIAFLQASPVLTENALSLASFECEPPDSNPEKERFKSLKSELNAQ